MNVFCQTDKVLPRDGDIPVWDTAEGRWVFRPGATAPDPTPPDPVDPEQPDPEQPTDPEQPEETVSAYEIGEWKDWYRAAPLPKWKIRNGELLTGVSTRFPELLAYLKLPENTWMLKDEPEWQAMSEAAGGIGGVWYYSLDEGADTIRLPDTRGDFSRDAGGRKGESPEDGVYGVGEWHGDAIRNITGSAKSENVDLGNEFGLYTTFTGVLGTKNLRPNYAFQSTKPLESTPLRSDIQFDASRVVPTAPENRPRAGMLLGCVYVGR